jgi:hypothetical protein
MIGKTIMSILKSIFGIDFELKIFISSFRIGLSIKLEDKFILLIEYLFTSFCKPKIASSKF